MSAEPSFSSSSSEDKGAESALDIRVEKILDSLLEYSASDLESAKALGDHPTAGRAFIRTTLGEARKEKSIQGVITQLYMIKSAVHARIGGFWQSTSESEARKQFMGMIDEKISLLKQLKVEEEKGELEERRKEIKDLSSEKEKAEEEVERIAQELEQKKEAAARWEKITALALGLMPQQPAGNSAILPAGDVNAAVFQLVTLMLSQKVEEQKQREKLIEEEKQKERAIEEEKQKHKAAQKQDEDVLEPKPYANYKLDQRAQKNVYALSDMQAMILYRKPWWICEVINLLLKKLELLKPKESSILSSNSNAFLHSSQDEQALKQAKIHNIQVILCYFFLYNAPMDFLIEKARQFALEQAEEFARKQAEQFPQKDRASIQNDWNDSIKNNWDILQIRGDEIPGLQEIQDIIQKQSQQDTYKSCNDFIQSRIKELPTQKDRDGTLLSEGYKETPTFKYHQLLGLIKLFGSLSIVEIFGNPGLVDNFYKTLRTRLKDYQADYKENPEQPTIDVQMQDEKLCWINSDVLLIKQQSSVELKKT